MQTPPSFIVCVIATFVLIEAVPRYPTRSQNTLKEPIDSDNNDAVDFGVVHFKNDLENKPRTGGLTRSGRGYQGGVESDDSESYKSTKQSVGLGGDKYADDSGEKLVGYGYKPEQYPYQGGQRYQGDYQPESSYGYQGGWGINGGRGSLGGRDQDRGRYPYADSDSTGGVTGGGRGYQSGIESDDSQTYQSTKPSLAIGGDKYADDSGEKPVGSGYKSEQYPYQGGRRSQGDYQPDSNPGYQGGWGTNGGRGSLGDRDQGRGRYPDAGSDSDYGNYGSDRRGRNRNMRWEGPPMWPSRENYFDGRYPDYGYGYRYQHGYGYPYYAGYPYMPFYQNPLNHNGRGIKKSDDYTDRTDNMDYYGNANQGQNSNSIKVDKDGNGNQGDNENQDGDALSGIDSNTRQPSQYNITEEKNDDNKLKRPCIRCINNIGNGRNNKNTVYLS